MSRRCCCTAGFSNNVGYLLSLEQQRRDDVAAGNGVQQQRRDGVAVGGGGAGRGPGPWSRQTAQPPSKINLPQAALTPGVAVQRPWAAPTSGLGNPRADVLRNWISPLAVA